MEPISGLEPETSSLPRKCSTAELYGQYNLAWPLLSLDANSTFLCIYTVFYTQPSYLPSHFLSAHSWSGWSGSNRHHQLGRLGFYHWTTPASTLVTGGGGRIRTYEGIASRFTVCPRWPLEYPSVHKAGYCQLDTSQVSTEYWQYLA